MPDSYTSALFNSENTLRDWGIFTAKEMSEKVYGMGQRKAQQLIKNAGAQIESQLIGQGEAAKYKEALLKTAGEGVATAVGGGAIGLGQLTMGFITALEGGYNISRATQADENPTASINPGQYVLIHNGFVPVEYRKDGTPVRAAMHTDPSFENTFNDYAAFGQTPDVEMGEGFERMADVSYGFYIEDVDALTCKVYNFELARPEDKEKRHVMLLDETKQKHFKDNPIDAIRVAYFASEQDLIKDGRLSVDPGTQVFEKNDPNTAYTVVQTMGDKVLIVPELGGNQKLISIEHLRPGRQEHNIQYNYGEALVNVSTPQGLVPIRTGAFLWFKIRIGLAGGFEGKLQSTVEIAILRDIDANQFQVVYAYDGAAVQYNSKTFYNNVIPFSDEDRTYMKETNFARFKAKVMDDRLENWQGYAPGQINSQLAAVSLGHLEISPDWHENLKLRQRATADHQRGAITVKKTTTTIIGERVPKSDRPYEIDAAEELHELGISGDKPVDIVYGHREVRKGLPAPSNSTNNMLEIAGAVIIGGYIMTRS